jgi:hypothetical protein
LTDHDNGQGQKLHRRQGALFKRHEQNQVYAHKPFTISSAVEPLKLEQGDRPTAVAAGQAALGLVRIALMENKAAWQFFQPRLRHARGEVETANGRQAPRRFFRPLIVPARNSLASWLE